MDKIIVLILALTILMTSCNSSKELNNKDLSETANPAEPQIMIELPLNVNLPEYVELITNTSDYLIISHLNSNIRDQKYNIEYSLGCSEGRIIYRQYTDTETVGMDHLLIFKFGVMDSLFEKITPPIYDEIFPFEYGCAVVKTDSGYGVMDLDGFALLECIYQYKPEVSYNYIRVLIDRDERNSEYNYFNKEDGSFLFTLKLVFDEEKNSYSMLKATATDGNELINELPGSESEKIIPFKDNETGLWGYMDNLKRTVISPLFDNTYPFSEGRAIVEWDGKFGYINEYGEILVDPIYDIAYDFQEGIACVMQDGKFGYITDNGGIMLDLEYSMAKSFSEGLAAVKTETGYSYINAKGEIIISGNYISAGEFSHGYASVKNKDNKYLYIDKFGNPAFDELTFEKAMDINEDGFGFAMSYDIIYEEDLEMGGSYNKAVFKIYSIHVKPK